MKTFLYLLLALFLVGGIAAYIGFSSLRKEAVPAAFEESVYLRIPNGSSFEQVVDSLQTLGVAEDTVLFKLLSDQLSYRREPMRAGRFELEPGWSYYQLIRQLRSGEQAPVKLILTTEREPQDVAGKAARFIAPDSMTIAALLLDTNYVDSIGYRPETLQSLFIPNTYEVYWNSTARGFVERMLNEHQKFWSQQERSEKAEALGLSPAEVYTLASIIEKETLVKDERRRMAGVYINRLNIGMRLQADPTAVFARRDFNTGRVTHYHTKFDSPYNTYLYAGLPPGPIAMASISSIDAVLNVEDHDYIYFCARGDGTSLHNFAESIEGHQRNIRIYKNNLRKRGIL